MRKETFPSRETMGYLRVPFTRADVVLVLGMLVLLIVIATVGAGMFVPFLPEIQEPPPVNLDPRYLPYYLARSTLRMFIALFFPIGFTLVYGYVAAKNRRAEKVETSKEIFRTQALARVPLIQMMTQTLNARKSGAMRAAFFEDILDEHFPADEAEQQFKTAVDWGRYAELFEYDAVGGWLTAPR